MSALDVARAIIEAQHQAGRSVDKKQLQKLLYLVQGTHLELWDAPAFRNGLTAYQWGPVVKTVEMTYRGAYPRGHNEIRDPVGGREAITNSVAEVVALVLDMYGDMSANELERITKLPGSPWEQVRSDLPPWEPSDIPIPIASISEWFGRYGSTPPGSQLSNAGRDALERIAAGDTEAIADLLR